MSAQLDLIELLDGPSNVPIRFVIFVSYGNDSIALIQWAHEQGLEGVAVVFTDTGWAADGWMERVEKAEVWVRSLGFVPHRTTSIGFRQLARDKSGFPTQRYQWCSFILKIEPGRKWLEQYDPDKRAICLVGVRRAESEDRFDFPEWLVKSANHGERMMLAPFATFSDEQRNEIIARAGFEVLPHRSRECRCINSKKSDIRRFTEGDKAAVREIEAEIGRPMFRPHRHMGATGIDEMVKWANSPKGKYQAPTPTLPAFDEGDVEPEKNLLECRDTFGACGS